MQLLVDDVAPGYQGTVPVLGAPAATGDDPPPEPSLPWQPELVHAFDLARPAMVRYAMALARHWQVPLALTPATVRSLWPDQEFAEAACAAADVLFALTQQEAETFPVPTGRRNRIHIVPQAPSLSGVPNPASVRALRERGPVVLFLGRRGRLKGYPELLDAAPLVWRTVPSTTFVVAGPAWDDDIGGPPRESHPPDPRFADPRLVDLGMVDEQTKLDVLDACDVLCLPSRADAFPLVFVEAWTLGRAVVTGDFPGVAGVVRHEVDALVTAVSPEGVAESLIRLLTDHALRSRLAAAGYERAARCLTWEAVAEAVAAGYREAIQLPRGAR
ncbi:glycosyltransferase family 4 protein [Micromonospora sp. NPDC049662]|uniref:glycosyltransferase family 4 protein n=1 Tax=Micromonospora sp. NPDC049662 TaxID=3155397 RepID=UPI00341D6649